MWNLNSKISPCNDKINKLVTKLKIVHAFTQSNTNLKCLQLHFFMFWFFSQKFEEGEFMFGVLPHCSCCAPFLRLLCGYAPPYHTFGTLIRREWRWMDRGIICKNQDSYIDINAELLFRYVFHYFQYHYNDLYLLDN